MGLPKKIAGWEAAGLISAQQAAGILAYESAHKGNRFAIGLIGAALLAILCGVLSIIAANWIHIPGEVKLVTHAAINALVGFFLMRATREGWREGLCLLLFGLTMTFIVLIGQVFQLGGGWADALMLWLVITTPLMLFFGKTRITAIPWILAFLGMVYIVIEEYVPEYNEFHGTLIAAGIALYLPLALIADGNLTLMQRYKPIWGQVWIKTGFILLLIAASLSSLFWYDAQMPRYMRLSTEADYAAFSMQIMLAALWISGFFAQLAYAGIQDFYRGDTARKAGALLALIATFFMGLPAVVGYELGGVAAALQFIFFWVLTGWIAQHQGWQRVVTLSIVLISIRIFLVYVEVFGSLLTTGFGLISGGVIMLALIWGARRLNRNLKEGA